MRLGGTLRFSRWTGNVPNSSRPGADSHADPGIQTPGVSASPCFHSLRLISGNNAVGRSGLAPSFSEVCILQKIHMTAVPSDTNTTNPEGNVTSYRAKLDFYLLKANKVITLTLYGNSVFI